MAETKVSAPELIYGFVKKRQGGSSSNWATAGTTNYDISATNVKIQVGTIACNANPKTITFPEAFTQNPIVLANVCTAAVVNSVVRVAGITTTTFDAQVLSDTFGGVTSETINWIAIGV